MSKRDVRVRQSLEVFMHGKVQAACPVCQLPADVRAQLGPAATKRGFTRDDQVEWLRTVHGATITVPDLSKHFSARHDRPLEG